MVYLHHISNSLTPPTINDYKSPTISIPSGAYTRKEQDLLRISLARERALLIPEFVPFFWTWLHGCRPLRFLKHSLPHLFLRPKSFPFAAKPFFRLCRSPPRRTRPRQCHLGHRRVLAGEPLDYGLEVGRVRLHELRLDDRHLHARRRRSFV
ncbi:unnamed protein product [Musa hybrid cultivar]